MIRVTCRCRHPFAVHESQVGQRATCPACGLASRVPQPQVAVLEPDDIPSVFVPMDDDPFRLTNKRRSGRQPSPPNPYPSRAGLVGLAVVGGFMSFLGFESVLEGYPRGGIAVAVFLAVCFLWIVVPLWLPATLSRRGVLSTARWLILSAFCGFVAVIGLASVEMEMRRDRPSLDFVSAACTCGVPALFGIGGCLLAAAIHRKP